LKFNSEGRKKDRKKGRKEGRKEGTREEGTLEKRKKEKLGFYIIK
jgi:hypothetical protein